jgi:hypothetical protein
MLARVHELVRMKSQFIIATHSPILMGYQDADLYQIEESGLVKTAYEETEHFLVTKAFLGNPSRQLALLLDRVRNDVAHSYRRAQNSELRSPYPQDRQCQEEQCPIEGSQD